MAADNPRPCPEGFPFTPFSAITRQLVAAAIKKMKNAAFETAIIQYRILFPVHSRTKGRGSVPGSSEPLWLG